MEDPRAERISALERRGKLHLAANAITLALFALYVFEPRLHVGAESTPELRRIRASELCIVDSRGVVRARLGGDLPDAVIGGKTVPRGQRAAGLLLYDDTGQERGGYVTFSPSGNVALTLDNPIGQTAEFVADPDSGSAIRLHWRDDAVELRADEDGPSIHAVHRKKVAFHEPAVERPEATALCKALKEARGNVPGAGLLEACRARTSESACRACLGN